MSDTTPEPNAPAGWYPEGANGQRYWDGTTWTDHRAPVEIVFVPPTRRDQVSALGAASFILGLVFFASVIGGLAVKGLAFLVFLSLPAAFVGIGLGIAAVIVISQKRRRGGVYAILGLALSASPFVLMGVSAALR